jgi:quercetin dioxygenase-like cupin family protein
MTVAEQLVSKRAEAPDEVRPYKDGTGQVEVVHLPGLDAGRATFEPGWRWSEHVKPIAGTESCQVTHVGYVQSGRMGIRMDDGTESEIGPGDFVHIPHGHDAWTIGDEACVVLDFGGLKGYAKPS